METLWVFGNDSIKICFNVLRAYKRIENADLNFQMFNMFINFFKNAISYKSKIYILKKITIG